MISFALKMHAVPLQVVMPKNLSVPRRHNTTHQRMLRVEPASTIAMLWFFNYTPPESPYSNRVARL